MPKSFNFQDADFIKDPIHIYGEEHADKCIIIDNGSHTCRAGWSNEDQPKLVFRNLIAKLRGKKENDAGSVLSVSYTHLRAHETEADLVCRLLLEKKK